MLVSMETEDSLRRGAIMVITKKVGLAHADFSLLCTPTVLIYNHELGIINSSEFFHTKNSRRRVMYFLVSLFFSEVWWEGTT